MCRRGRQIVLHGGTLGENIVDLAALGGGRQVDTADQRNVVIITADELFCQLGHFVLQPDHLADKAEQFAALAVIHPFSIISGSAALS